MSRRVEETEFVLWILTPRCHFLKTNNRPSAAHWLLLFKAHCLRYAKPVGVEGWAQDGYRLAAEAAEKKLLWLRAKGTSGEAA